MFAGCQPGEAIRWSADEEARIVDHGAGARSLGDGGGLVELVGDADSAPLCAATRKTSSRPSRIGSRQVRRGPTASAATATASAGGVTAGQHRQCRRRLTCALTPAVHAEVALWHALSRIRAAIRIGLCSCSGHASSLPRVPILTGPSSETNWHGGRGNDTIRRSRTLSSRGIGPSSAARAPTTSQRVPFVKARVGARRPTSPAGCLRCARPTSDTARSL